MLPRTCCCPIVRGFIGSVCITYISYCIRFTADQLWSEMFLKLVEKWYGYFFQERGVKHLKHPWTVGFGVLPASQMPPLPRPLFAPVTACVIAAISNKTLLLHITQLSNLWCLPISVSKGFSPTMKDDFNNTPQPVCEFQVGFHLLLLRINQANTFCYP